MLKYFKEKYFLKINVFPFLKMSVFRFSLHKNIIRYKYLIMGLKYQYLLNA